ncbi:hypothetical protein [Streptomyces sp. SID12488]|uniref:hypothetical protein n=1 Tax=Streptomyces sp. SID12488 TaxID=2706040 RepID=UPI0013DD55F4|nr:hypothetical protein [Streptomyces sp. SID12488]NEA68406.1 hypothetical protein [Streptomyces sp. SID12488]
MAAREYSAEISVIRAASGGIGALAGGGEHMVSDFEAGVAETVGWWGDEGGDDLFADRMGEQCRKEEAQVIETATSITGFVNALFDAVDQEADHVQRPQTLAMDDIDAQSLQSEERR